MTLLNAAELAPLCGVKLLLNVNSSGLKPDAFAKRHAEQINQLLDANGALLIRGLKVHSSRQFGQLLTILFGTELAEYQYRSTPRTQLGGKVYTATEYPASEVILQHNENAYANVLPTRLGFCCMVNSPEGGQTPIGDVKNLDGVLSSSEKARFERLGVRYVRNYSDLDIPWWDVFQTDDKQVVEQYCSANRINLQWQPDNGLRTWQNNPAYITHPQTGEQLWVNQAHLFHISAQPVAIQQTLLASLSEAGLPRNTYYGDGSAIAPELIARLHQSYEDSKILFDWQRNDLLLLDNLRFTHGRMPFNGNRKVLVGMAGKFATDAPI
jgi:hypothetical protein